MLITLIVAGCSNNVRAIDISKFVDEPVCTPERTVCWNYQLLDVNTIVRGGTVRPAHDNIEGQVIAPDSPEEVIPDRLFGPIGFGNRIEDTPEGFAFAEAVVAKELAGTLCFYSWEENSNSSYERFRATTGGESSREFNIVGDGIAALCLAEEYQQAIDVEYTVHPYFNGRYIEFQPTHNLTCDALAAIHLMSTIPIILDGGITGLWAEFCPEQELPQW